MGIDESTYDPEYEAYHYACSFCKQEWFVSNKNEHCPACGSFETIAKRLRNVTEILLKQNDKLKELLFDCLYVNKNDNSAEAMMQRQKIFDEAVASEVERKKVMG